MTSRQSPQFARCCMTCARSHAPIECSANAVSKSASGWPPSGLDGEFRRTRTILGRSNIYFQFSFSNRSTAKSLLIPAHRLPLPVPSYQGTTGCSNLAPNAGEYLLGGHARQLQVPLQLGGGSCRAVAGRIEFVGAKL